MFDVGISPRFQTMTLPPLRRWALDVRCFDVRLLLACKSDELKMTRQLQHLVRDNHRAHRRESSGVA